MISTLKGLRSWNMPQYRRKLDRIGSKLDHPTGNSSNFCPFSDDSKTFLSAHLVYAKHIHSEDREWRCSLCTIQPRHIARFPWSKDLAEIACEVILNPINHNWATYELVGENTSLNNVAQIIGRVASLPDLRCELVPRETFLNEGLAHAGADTREGLGRMLYYYDQR